MTQMPLVSILIPAFNCEAWVGAAIQSALVQSWLNKEVIVFDDGSADETLNIIRGFGSAVRYDSARLGGQNVVRNRLTNMAEGEWLVFLDADDTLAPDSVEKKMVFAGAAEAIYGSMEVARFSGQRKIGSFIEPAVENIDIWTALFGWRFPNTSAMMLKKEAVLAAGGWNEAVHSCTDYAIYFPIAKNGGRFQPVPESLSLYRHWSTSQASYENAVRRSHTRLDLMLGAVQFLKKNGDATLPRLNAWADGTLNSLRFLQGRDQSRVKEFLHHIRDIHPHYRPEPPAFTRLYAGMYRFFGFYAAQWAADISRGIRRKCGLLRLDPERYYLPGGDFVQG